MRSGWMRLVRMAAAGTLAGGLLSAGAGGAEVKNVTAVQRWPWNGKVDVRFEVEGELPETAVLVVTAEDRMVGQTYTASLTALSGDMGKEEGPHHVVWDLNAQGVSFQSTNVVFTASYPLTLYCVLDLSGGANASAYPITYMGEPPSGGFNTDEYKTTKLVLRRIEAGTFTMGSPSDEPGRLYNETQHPVTLTKPYYIGLFEVTQKQYALVMGINPSRFLGDKLPVENVSWNTIRGNDGWPGSSSVSADSFMGRLRARTGLANFDLPTEAQWEYACRAGTTTAYSYGDSGNGDYMWYEDNSSSQTHAVGTKKSNPWGLYDMHGNVWEWCLDWETTDLGTAAVTDPKGASSGGYRMLRGGAIGNKVGGCRSASRNFNIPTYEFEGYGFRLSRMLSE